LLASPPLAALKIRAKERLAQLVLYDMLRLGAQVQGGRKSVGGGKGPAGRGRRRGATGRGGPARAPGAVLVASTRQLVPPTGG
jgi:hypothetical protein